jgi:hypothetical protein
MQQGNHKMKSLQSRANGKIGVGYLIVILIVLGIIVSQHSQNNNAPSFRSVSSSPPIQSAADMKQHIIDQVEIEKLGWYKSGSDNIMMVNVTFKNKGTRDVKDIELTCEHYASSGTKIDSNIRVIYEIVKAGRSKRVRNFNMGFIHSQAVSTSCRITDLTVL